jgi:peptidoglycan/LPS O-acetylase OafA/YrhL
MLKYLFIKNVKTDAEFKTYQFLKLSSFIMAIILIVMISSFTVTSPYGLTAKIFRIFWFALTPALVAVSYAREIRRQLKDSGRLRAKRIEQTDERRKQAYQQALAHIGIAALILLVLATVFSLNTDKLTIPEPCFSGLLTIFVIYILCRIDK